jgi:cytochrome P450
VLPSPCFARFIPFSGGPRKCVGDQFALLEAIVALAIVVQKMDVQLVADQKINMTTGATIHTTNVRKHGLVCIILLLTMSCP